MSSNSAKAIVGDISTTGARRAAIYRMVMPEHICPYGLKAVSLLHREGYIVEDHWLTNREQTDQFKTEHRVSATPQVFIDGRRIGGYDNLREYVGKRSTTSDAPTYRPIATVLVCAASIAAAFLFTTQGLSSPANLLAHFVSLSMCILALLKLQDVEGFSTMFLNYDLLARRWVPYAYLYPYAEFMAGLLMIAGLLPWISAPLALVIGAIGAVSVIKAVYVDKRSLKCACVGGGSSVPLGLVSLLENLIMIGMAVATVLHGGRTALT